MPSRLVLGVLLGSTHGWDHTLVRDSASCAVDDSFLGHHCTATDCASVCATTPGCWFFSLGRGALHECRCWAKYTADDDCTDGQFVGDDNYDFYRIDGLTNKTGGPFMFMREPRQYNGAKVACEGVGGQLASIHTPEENAAAWSLCRPFQCWIGLSDHEQEGNWQWSDGWPADFTRFPGGVAPWGPGQPDNQGLFGGDSDGAYIYTQTNQYTVAGGMWDDSPYDMNAGYLCRMGATPPPPKPSRIGPFSFVADHMTYHAAAGHCRNSVGGHLASIHTPEENADVLTLCAPEMCWIGFSDRATEGTWLWEDGSPAQFASFLGGSAPWNPGQPDNSGLFGADSDAAYMAPASNQYVMAGTWVSDAASR